MRYVALAHRRRRRRRPLLVPLSIILPCVPHHAGLAELIVDVAIEDAGLACRETEAAAAAAMAGAAAAIAQCSQRGDQATRTSQTRLFVCHPSERGTAGAGRVGQGDEQAARRRRHWTGNCAAATGLQCNAVQWQTREACGSIVCVVCPCD